LFTRKRTTRVALVGLVAAASLVAVAGCADTPEPAVTVTNSAGETYTQLDIVAGVATSMSSVDLLIGIQHGFFKEVGLNVTTVPVQTGAAGVTQLTSNQIQVALGGLSGTISAVAGGNKIVFISGGIADAESSAGTWYQTLVSPTSGISSFKDLAGKKVAVNSLNCCWDYWTREAITAAGGDQSKVQLVQIGFAQQAAALKAGQVDAITTQQPFAKQAEVAGFKSLGDPAAIAYGSKTNGNTDYFSAQAYLDAHPDFVKRWRIALKKSADYANSHPDEVRSMGVSVVNLDGATVAAMPLPNFVVDIDKDAIQKEIDWGIKYKTITTAPTVAQLVAP